MLNEEAREKEDKCGWECARTSNRGTGKKDEEGEES